MSSTPTLDRLAEFERQREDIEVAERRFLESRGWLYTSATPGSLWMYEKKLADGRTVIVDLETACTFEEWLCGEDPDDAD